MRQPTPDACQPGASLHSPEPNRQVIDVQFYPLAGVVEVEMLSGGLLQYFRVPADTAAEFASSQDRTTYYLDNIEGKYHCQKLG